MDYYCLLLLFASKYGSADISGWYPFSLCTQYVVNPLIQNFTTVPLLI